MRLKGTSLFLIAISSAKHLHHPILTVSIKVEGTISRERCHLSVLNSPEKSNNVDHVFPLKAVHFPLHNNQNV